VFGKIRHTLTTLSGKRQNTREYVKAKKQMRKSHPALKMPVFCEWIPTISMHAASRDTIRIMFLKEVKAGKQVLWFDLKPTTFNIFNLELTVSANTSESSECS